MTSVQDASLVVEGRQLASSGEGKRIRVASNLPPADLARSLDIDPATLWRWENGKRLPRGDRAVRYAKILAKLAKGLA